MRRVMMALFLVGWAVPVAAQTPPAVDVSAPAVQAFLKALPPDKISDSPIRIVDAGSHKVGVYGVFRPKSIAAQGAVVHETKVSEIYYMLDGAGTLVTGGTLKAPVTRTNGSFGVNLGAGAVEGGATRRIAKGDMVIIPGGQPHWWSSLESDLTYLIFRPDPGLSFAAQMPPPAVDVSAAAVQAFLKALPPNKNTDSPMRVVDAGGYKVGVYGVLRLKSILSQGANLHETKVSEIYYILDGAGVLVTGGTLKGPITKATFGFGVNESADSIEGGLSRRVTKGDIVIIPGGVAHWWASIESDLTHLIFRPDPDGKQPLK